MSGGLFGRGGKAGEIKPTGPMPLDLSNENGFGSIGRSPSTSYGRGNGGYSGGFNSGNQRDKKTVDTVHEFSDMDVADKLEDEDIRLRRLEGYDLANEERNDDIRHKNDFNLIVKIIMVIFTLLVGIGFIVYFIIFSKVSIDTGKVAEPGILSAILQFIIEMIKVVL